MTEQEKKGGREGGNMCPWVTGLGQKLAVLTNPFLGSLALYIVLPQNAPSLRPLFGGIKSAMAPKLCALFPIKRSQQHTGTTGGNLLLGIQGRE